MIIRYIGNGLRNSRGAKRQRVRSTVKSLSNFLALKP